MMSDKINDTTGIIITIDGPAGAGKSTVAKRLAAELEIEYLDTGAMYRAVALLGIRQGINWDAPEELARLAGRHKIRSCRGRTYLDDEDVTDAVRLQEVTKQTRFAANNPAIRQMMVQLQRETAAIANCVTEGRDQGTVVFPDAFCKFYLTATPEERASRRQKELEQRGETVDFQELMEQINRRDQSDSNRAVGPLREPEYAVRINSDNRSVEDIVASMKQVVLTRLEQKNILNKKNGF